MVIIKNDYMVIIKNDYMVIIKKQTITWSLLRIKVEEMLSLKFKIIVHI